MPMQWNNSSRAGFSTSPDIEPWLPVSASLEKRNVEQQEQDPNSLLNCYRNIIRMRKNNPALEKGSLQLIGLGKLAKKCLAYRRNDGSQTLFVYLNFSGKSLKVLCPVKRPVLVFSTSGSSKIICKEDSIILAPYEGVVIAESSENVIK
jgi:glycosidase